MIIHPVGKWWKTIKHSIAWRLLEVAKTGDHSDRLKAVWQLARIDHLKGKLKHKIKRRVFVYESNITNRIESKLINNWSSHRLGLPTPGTNM